MSSFRGFRRSGILAAAAASIVISGAGAAVSGGEELHLQLVGSIPASDSTISTPPAELQLFFSEAVRTGVSAVRLMRADSTQVPLEALVLGAVPTDTVKARTAHPPLVAKIRGSIGDGRYTVLWRTASADGHVMNGEYHFTVRATTGSD